MPHSSFQSFPSARTMREVSGSIQQRAIHCARRQIHGSHEILGSRNRDVDSTLWKASEHLCMSIRHRATLTPIERSLESTICGRAFIRHPANLPFPPLPRDGPPLCQPNGRRLPTVWGAMSQGVVASSETIVGYAECLWDGRG